MHHPGGTDSYGMQCYENLVHYLSCGILLAGLVHLVHHQKAQASYGRHMVPSSARTVPARLAWFLQGMPALLIPVLFLQFSHKSSHTGKHLILKTFCLNYFSKVRAEDASDFLFWRGNACFTTLSCHWNTCQACTTLKSSALSKTEKCLFCHKEQESP